MKISLFYEFPLPRPWTDDDEHKLFQDGLDEVGRGFRVALIFVEPVCPEDIEENEFQIVDRCLVLHGSLSVSSCRRARCTEFFLFGSLYARCAGLDVALLGKPRNYLDYTWSFYRVVKRMVSQLADTP